MNLFRKLFHRPKQGPLVIQSTVDRDFINAAFDSVATDIESLRKYDRGEKKINAPDLTKFVRNLRNTAQ